MAVVKEDIRSLAFQLVASAIGICHTEGLIERFDNEIREIARKLPIAISVGIALQKAILNTIINRPNDIYKAHYRLTNIQLDNIIYRMAGHISSLGYQSLQIPASFLMRAHPEYGHLNHREIAHKAGLGWRGKNNLLVSSQFGSRLRLATLLTDLPLPPDETILDNCGNCRACRSKCPVGAIGDSPEQFDLEKCREQVTRFSRENNYGQMICGLCLRSCPEKKGEH